MRTVITHRFGRVSRNERPICKAFSISPHSPFTRRGKPKDSPADSGGPNVDQHLPLARLHIRLPDHMHLLVGIVRTREIDLLVALLDVLVDLFLREDLEVWVVEDFRRVVLPHEGLLRVAGVGDGVRNGLVDSHFICMGSDAMLLARIPSWTMPCAPDVIYAGDFAAMQKGPSTTKLTPIAGPNSAARTTPPPPAMPHIRSSGTTGAGYRWSRGSFHVATVSSTVLCSLLPTPS